MKHRNHRPLGLITAIALAGFSLAGCSTVLDEAVGAAGRRVGQGIGDAVGQRVGEAAGGAIAAQMPTMWGPEVTQVYMNYMFTMAFHSGSYTFEGTDYAVGEWTRWRMTESGGPQPNELERALLHRRDDGMEWWRVKYVSETGEGRDSVVVEALFDPESGEFLRMRGKMPGEEEAHEMPVEEGRYGYTQPRRLTDESLEGAMVGTETVRVPAGSYTAEHVRYGGMGGGTYDWWLSDEVPGGMVKYSRSFESQDTEGPDPYNWVVELLDSGTGATSELGVEH
jgi:hypothetical protein